jgi:hypothetical protein
MEQSRAKVYITKDPLLAFNVEDRKLNEVVIRESPDTISFQPTTANSITSSGVSYVLVQTGPTTVLDRNILENITGTLTFGLAGGTYDATTGAFTAGDFPSTAYADLKICVRANPITSVSTSCSANIDGVVVQLPNAYAVSSVLNRFNNKASAKASVQSYSSPMYDSLSYNSEMVQAACNPWAELAQIDISEDAVPPRTTAITGITIGAADPTSKIAQVTVTFNVTEALQLPGFNSDEGPSKGIYGIKNIAITRNFQNFLRMFQIAFKTGEKTPKYQISSPSVTFSSAQLMCRYFTPRDPASLPSTQRLFCPEVTVFNTNPIDVPPPCSNDAVLSGAGGTQLVFNNVISPQIPKYIILWISYSRDSLAQPQAMLAADRIFPIKSITLSIGNKATTLQGVTLQNLYKMSLESLSYCNYAQFIGQRYGALDANKNRASVNGFPLCLDMSLLNMDQDTAAGMRSQISIAANITFANTGCDNAPSTYTPQGLAGAAYATRTSNILYPAEYIPPQCQGYMLLLTPGILQIQDGAVSRSVGLFSMQELRSAEHVEARDEDARKGSLMGHGFWDTLGDIAHAAAPLLGALGRVEGRGLNASGLNAQGSIGGSVIGGRKMFY